MKKPRTWRYKIAATLFALMTWCAPQALATTVTGTVKDAAGRTIPRGRIVFTLSQEGITATPELIVTVPPVMCAITSGEIAANCTVEGNDTISPAGTRYKVRILSATGAQIMPERSYEITGATWAIDENAPDPVAVVTEAHGSSLHTGNIFPATAANQTVGGAYIDVTGISTPANPASGTRRFFVDSGSGEISVRTNAGTTVSLEGGGGSGHTIKEEGTPLTARSGLNFVGPAVTATDDAGNDETDVTVVASGVGSCTNQVVTALIDGSAPTCTTVTSGYTSGTFSPSAHDLVSGTHTASALTTGQPLRATAATTFDFGALDLGNSNAITGILGSANGGTGNGFTKFTGPTTSEKTFTLPDASSTLLYSGDSHAPTAHNLFSVSHGDTVAASPVLGDIAFGNVTPAWDQLAGNITTTTQFLSQTGTGAVSAAPAWTTLGTGDIPDLSGSYATLALDNLSSVALNLPLLPDAAAADDFGSATLPFKDIFFAGTSGTPGTNNFKITGASTSGTRTITAADGNSVTVIPDAGAASNFLTAIATTGVISKAQPAFTNISGTATAGQVPNLESLNGTLDVSSGGTGAAPGADDQVLVADSASAATWRAVPTCNTVTEKTFYNTSTNTWTCEADAGAGGGAPVGVQYVVGAVDATLTAEKVLTDGTGIDTVLSGGDGGAATINFDFAQTLAGNPAFNAKECIFTVEGASGGGFLCEGSVGANTNEQLYLFPALDGVDTTTFIALAASDGDALAGDSATSFFDAGNLELARLPFGTANQLLKTNAGGTAQEHATLSGSTNELDVSFGAGTIEIGIVAAPQITTSIQSPFFVSSDANPADGGALRLGNAEDVCWELAAPGVDKCLTLNASDQYEFDGDLVVNPAGTTGGSFTFGGPSSTAASFNTFYGGDAASNAEAPYFRLIPSPVGSGDDSFIFPCSTGGEAGISTSTPSADCTTAQTIERQGNKNAASGYAGLTAGTKLTAAQGQEVWALADLTDVASVTGSGTAAVLGTNPTLTDVIIASIAEFTETAGDPTCAAGNYNIKGNSSTGKMRGCENGTLFDLNTAGGSTHDILSATHTDTTAAAVVRGDLMVGIGVTPKWERYAKGTQYQVLTGGVNEPTWGAVDLAQATAVTGVLPAANWTPLTTEGDLLYRNATITTRLPRGADTQCLTSNATTILWGACGGGGGDNISVNGTAAADADFDDATPAAPANALNVKWQKDAGTPNNISAYVPWAQGTITASTPLVNHTVTWNQGATTFTNIFSNTTDTASAAASLLIDLQVGGTSQFKVQKDGATTFGGTGNMTLAAPAGNNSIVFTPTGTGDVLPSTTGFDLGSSTAPFADFYFSGTSGTPGTNNFKLTGASTGGTRTLTLPDATDTLVGKATTDTFTGKTYDAEGTGNVLTLPSNIILDAALCIGATATNNWDDAGTGDTAPTAQCNDTGSIQRPTAGFAGGAVNSFERTIKLPSTWTGNIDLTIRYVSTAASPTGNVEWDISTVCRAVGETWDAAFNTAQTITDAQVAQNTLNDATQATLTTTGCAAGEDFTLKVSRDGTSDTSNDDAQMLYAEIVLRRAI